MQPVCVTHRLGRMFLRCNRRTKDGKTHEYWSVVENRRLADGRVVQRQVLYLGEINASQREAWRKTIEVQDEATRRQVALFPLGSLPADDSRAVAIRLDALRLERPRQWGACWLSCELWQQLDLDAFWSARLPPVARGHAVAAGPANTGRLPADRSRFRMATAPPLVR